MINYGLRGTWGEWRKEKQKNRKLLAEADRGKGVCEKRKDEFP